jgi:hypothetical protein
MPTMLAQAEAATNDRAPAAVARVSVANRPSFRRIWSFFIVGFGLVLTAAWAGLLGYALIKLIIALF